jgi:hypothetical protein
MSPSTTQRPDVRVAVAAALVLALGALLNALTTNGAVLRLVGGAAFVVAIGASITSLLRLGSEDRVERTALALGLGLSAVIVGGLLLDVVDALDPTGWIGFGALIIGVGLLAAAPRRVHSLSARTGPAGPRTQRATSPVLVAVTGLVCVAAVGVALAIAVDSAHEQTGAGFTTLAFDVPTARGADLGLLVENRERVASTYRLVATAGDTTLLSVDELELAADERRELSVPVAGVAAGTQVSVVLYRDGGAEPYRHVTVTVP